MLLFSSPCLSITLFSIGRISGGLKSLKPGTGEQQKPEARTSCLKDGDMSGDSEVGWMDRATYLTCLELYPSYNFRWDKKLGREQIIKKKSQPSGQMDLAILSHWLLHTFTEFSQNIWKTSTQSLKIHFLATVGKGGAKRDNCVLCEFKIMQYILESNLKYIFSV